MEVEYLDGLEAARWLEKAILQALEQHDLTSAFFLLTKLQSHVLAFLLDSTASEPSYLAGIQRQEYLSILSGVNKAVSRTVY